MSIESQRKLFDDYCDQRFGKDGQHSSKTITKAKGQRIVQMLRGDPAAEQYGAKCKFWVKHRGFQLVTYTPLGLKDVLCLPAKKKVSHKDIVYECRRKQSISKHAYFITTYYYRTQMTQQSCPVGDGWPLSTISSTFSKTFTARRRGTLKARKPLRRYMPLM